MPEPFQGREPAPSVEEAFIPAVPETPAEQLETKPFLEHLKELRTTLLKIIGVFVVCAIVCFVALKPIAGLLLRPLAQLEASKGLEPGTITLMTLGPSEGFAALMSIVFGAALGLSLPFTLWFIAQFVSPGLTPGERRAVAPGLIAGVLLFVAGVLFAFFVTSSLLVGFLYRLYEGLGWRNAWTVRDYYAFLTQFLLVTGLTFELPLVLALLVRVEVLSLAQLRQYRRHALIAILLLAAVFTPPDAASMFLVAGPMYTLYEASIAVSTLLRRRARGQKPALRQ
ncbi:MAG: twin-arginine translocase subunit TatC [Verrucomicrobia bacterium]|nr:twin-arginine translocase subunit TatC [Verrucomicrobiota bacterium]